MVALKFNKVCIEAAALHLPETVVTSAEVEDRLAPLYQRLQIPFGTLEKLSGIKSRCLWPKEVKPSQIAAAAGKKALEEIAFDPELIQVLFNCSVCRDYFEPATASIVHAALGLPETGMTMDISNACLGFSNGMLTLANMIETGIVKAGIIVSGENVSSIQESSLNYLIKGDAEISREQLIRLLPTFTLGCGGAAMVLCHESISRNKHRLSAAVLRSASHLNDLCVGNADFCHAQGLDLTPIMETDSQKIISSAAKLGARVWPELSEAVGWQADQIDHLFSHQVGKQLNASFFQEIGISNKNELTVYPRYGNQVSAALPIAFATGISERNFKSGDKILLTGFGSGLNAIFSSIIW